MSRVRYTGPRADLQGRTGKVVPAPRSMAHVPGQHWVRFDDFADPQCVFVHHLQREPDPAHVMEQHLERTHRG